MSRVRKRVLIGTITAPMRAIAKKIKRYSGLLASHRQTWLPGSTPAAMRPFAARSVSSRNWVNDHRRPGEAERFPVAPLLGSPIHELAESQLLEPHGGPPLVRS